MKHQTRMDPKSSTTTPRAWFPRLWKKFLEASRSLFNTPFGVFRRSGSYRPGIEIPPCAEEEALAEAIRKRLSDAASVATPAQVRAERLRRKFLEPAQVSLGVARELFRRSGSHRPKIEIQDSAEEEALAKEVRERLMKRKKSGWMMTPFEARAERLRLIFAHKSQVDLAVALERVRRSGSNRRPSLVQRLIERF